jgi:hypothetical protein
MKKQEKERPRKNLWPWRAAGLYYGEETWEGPSAIRVTLRGTRAHLSYRLGFLSILWWEKGGWRGMGIRKMTAKGESGKELDIIGKVIGAGQPAIRVVSFLWLFYRKWPCLHCFSVSQYSSKSQERARYNCTRDVVRSHCWPFCACVSTQLEWMSHSSGWLNPETEGLARPHSLWNCWWIYPDLFQASGGSLAIFGAPWFASA